MAQRQALGSQKIARWDAISLAIQFSSLNKSKQLILSLELTRLDTNPNSSSGSSWSPPLKIITFVFENSRGDNS